MKHLWITFFLSLLLTLLFSSCRTIYVDRPVTIERTQHDTITVNNSTRDSVYLKDSIYIHAIGDTIYRDRWHTKYVERKVRYDSIIVQRDTIEVPVQTTVTETKRYIPWYAKFMSSIGIFAIVALIVYLLGRSKWW